MPYKANESGRHEIPRVRYRVENWSAYDAGGPMLESRGVERGDQHCATRPARSIPEGAFEAWRVTMVINMASDPCLPAFC